MFAIARTPLLALTLSLAVTACGHVPLASLLKLSGVDFATTDISAIRAGIALPETLEPLADTVKLTVLAETDDGVTIRRSFMLEEAPAGEDTSGLDADENIRVYRLKEREAEDLAVVRADVLARKEKAGGGKLEISVGATACRTGALPDSPLPMSTYLKTSETGSFVPLTRDVDLRSLGGNPELVAAIPPCFAGVAGS